MSYDPFPERIDAIKLFARNGSISAALPLARLQRLTASLADTGGKVAVELEFGHDEEGRQLLTGTLDVPVRVLCQRCLQEMALDLHSDLHLLVTESDEKLQELPETEDAVVMDESGLDVPALIEDELILSLPLVPMHADPACNEVFNALRQDSSATAGSAKPNPFSVLAGLNVGKTEPKDR